MSHSNRQSKLIFDDDRGERKQREALMMEIVLPIVNTRGKSDLQNQTSAKNAIDSSKIIVYCRLVCEKFKEKSNNTMLAVDKFTKEEGLDAIIDAAISRYSLSEILAQLANNYNVAWHDLAHDCRNACLIMGIPEATWGNYQESKPFLNTNLAKRIKIVIRNETLIQILPLLLEDLQWVLEQGVEPLNNIKTKYDKQRNIRRNKD
jgi:hypothetical protein